MWIGTFHGLCNRFLRAHWKLAGLPQGFQILDSSGQLAAVKRVVTGLGLEDERFVPSRPGLPMLLCSGYATEAQAAEAADHGVREVLAKERIVEDLVPAVARVWEA